MDSKETLIRIVLLSLLLYAAVCLANLGQNLRRAEALESALAARLQTIEKDNLAVSEKLTEGWSAEELESLARERLGLVLPGDRIFHFPSDSRAQTP